MKKVFNVLLLLLAVTVATQAQTTFDNQDQDECMDEIAYVSPETGQAFNKTEFKEAIIHMLKTRSCEFKGIKLYGKVKFVTSFPDIKIKYVTSFPDIKVKFVTSFPDKCGKWKKVTSFPDFKVKVVTSFPDLKVKKVTSFPGMN